MIRFVDIRTQNTGYRFAFWDTTRDKFCEFGGDQAWESAADFINSFYLAKAELTDTKHEFSIERFLSLMPNWATTPADKTDEL